MSNKVALAKAQAALRAQVLPEPAQDLQALILPMLVPLLLTGPKLITYS